MQGPSRSFLLPHSQEKEELGNELGTVQRHAPSERRKPEGRHWQQGPKALPTSLRTLVKLPHPPRHYPQGVRPQKEVIQVTENRKRAEP